MTLRLRFALGGLGIALGAGLLAGCGGTGAETTITTGAYAPIQGTPLVPGSARKDPDQGPKTSADLYTRVVALGEDRYRLEITSTSSVGFINEFTWFPGPGVRVLAVTGTRFDKADDQGRCELSQGKISCKLSLQPPTCTCRGDGGTVSIGFRAKSAGTAKDAAVSFGSNIFVESQTPVPYVIPGSPDSKLSDLADLPLCASGQESTAAKPCLRRG